MSRLGDMPVAGPQPAPIQTAPWLSVITVSDGDPDRLAATAASLGDRLPDDVEWIVQVLAGVRADKATRHCRIQPTALRIEADAGPYDAMNRATASARGRYRLYLNAGDLLWSADVIARPWPECRPDPETGQPPSVILGACWEKTGEHWCRKRARDRGALFWGMPTHHQAMLFHHTAIGAKPYDLRFRVAADYALLCRLAAEGHRFLVTDRTVCLFAGGGLSERLSSVGRHEQMQIRHHWLRHSRLRAALTGCIQWCVSRFKRVAPGLYRQFRYRERGTWRVVIGPPAPVRSPSGVGANRGRVEAASDR